MSLLFQLLEQASLHAARNAADAAAGLKKRDLAARRLHELRRESLAQRRHSGVLLESTLLGALPKTAGEALALSAIKEQLAVRAIHCDLRSALSRLFQARRVARVGQARNYRYYNPN
jgi:hypothetical protein